MWSSPTAGRFAKFSLNGRVVLLTFLVFALLGAGQLVRGEEASHPNVLFLIVDDLNDWIGCLGGHPQARTPHMDALAARGTLFTNAHCQAPICGPSRVSFLSGRYPHETGLYNQPRGKGRMIDDERFFRGHLLPEYFKSHGYETLGVGKITHGYPLNEAVETAGPQGGPGPKPEGPRPPDDVRFHFRPDYSQPYTGTQTDWGAFPERDEQMPDFETATWALKELARERETPFFLAVGFHRPHVPFYVPQKWFDLHPLDLVTLPEVEAFDLDDVPETGRRVHELPRYPQPDWLRENENLECKRSVQAYLASVSFVDEQVGRVLEALEHSPYRDNTVIVLFSDHGYHLGEKDRVSKHGLWEESTRVPLVIAEPGGNPGQTSSRPVGLVDLYPTLLELCGLDEKAGLSGRSLVPLLRDPTAEWRHSILTTYAFDNHALRSDRYRFIRYEDGSEELYDHQVDPHEWRNLALERSMAAVLGEFRSRLPRREAPYHPAVGRGSVNAWFVEHFRRHGVGE